jgi:hypothetical protein
MTDNELPICACSGKEISKVPGTGENIKIDIGGKKMDFGTICNGKFYWDCHKTLYFNRIMDLLIIQKKSSVEDKCQICRGDMYPISSKVWHCGTYS